MGRTMSATDARVHFGEVMRHVVERREPIIVERGGKPHVVVIAVDEYERLLADQQGRTDWRELVRQARQQVRVDLRERDLLPPEEVLRQIREERDEQLVDLR